MKFSIQREAFLQPLTQVVGVVERRQTLPVLANFLLVADGDTLSVTGTDMEVELVARIKADISQPGEVTVPARKLVDIVKALPDGAGIELTQEGDKVLLKAGGRSRFTLATLPASEFPATDQVEALETVQLKESAFKHLLDTTSFAMANQDVRYYLNGLLLDFVDGELRAVATDGHRLAVCELGEPVGLKDNRSLIVPRKGVLELARMLDDGDGTVELAIGKNHIRLVKGATVFTSKLIDGRFPDYSAVIPSATDKLVALDRNDFIRALQRAAILSNEKYRGVRLEMESGAMRIVAHNPQHEEAEEQVGIEQNFDKLAVGFNVTYLLEALNSLDQERVSMELTDANSSCLLRNPETEKNRHVIMPLKL